MEAEKRKKARANEEKRQGSGKIMVTLKHISEKEKECGQGKIAHEKSKSKDLVKKRSQKGLAERRKE